MGRICKLHNLISANFVRDTSVFFVVRTLASLSLICCKLSLTVIAKKETAVATTASVTKLCAMLGIFPTYRRPFSWLFWASFYLCKEAQNAKKLPPNNTDIL